MKPAEALPLDGWHASLSLGFAANNERCWLAQRRHSGPLLVQRTFYPEDLHLCQTVIVHPPGGIAGGDRLEIEIIAGDHSSVQLTTPGAGKWYRGFGREAGQSVRIRVGDGALCEWLPQENIVFDGALANMSLDVELSPSAAFCGWDFTCLGRPASESPFSTGKLRQSTVIRRNGKSIFWEQATIDAAEELRTAKTMLADYCAYGSMFVVSAPPDADVMAAAREVISSSENAGVTWLDGVLVARWVGHHTEEGRALFTRLWSVLRPRYAGRAAVTPRIWAT